MKRWCPTVPFLNIFVVEAAGVEAAGRLGLSFGWDWDNAEPPQASPVSRHRGDERDDIFQDGSLSPALSLR